ncbi:hypothetical protein EX895_002458 [Sporisorium graminicola]|uniref:ER membrane protein complex subunit 2 n=1 Tax=Sporisorium graminicola TaxID=280036 RepID=A0A4U7KVD7_9BASI|nr:hypothetical protein EX895_002458 [Sporisorium graminicola]TKY88470.1 hypothetical protein EX895_002458 [Sporisorium graminicola]
MATAHFQVSGNPESDPKAAAQWLAEQRRRPIRAPHKTVEYGELVITKGGLSSVSNEDLWSILEQVAIAAIEVARFDLAELCISRLTSRFPNSQRVTSLQGMLLEGQGKLDEAIRLYDEALEKEETSLILSRRRIAAIKSTGDAKRTLEALNAHLDTFYNDPEAWQELAEVYANQGFYTQSAFALEELLLQIPQNGFFHLKYAETLYTNGDTIKAYKAYLRVLELCQSDRGATDEHESSKQTAAQGPWLRALWGTKMTTTALIAAPPASSKTSTTDDTVDQAKVKKIDELVTNLLLTKVYTPQAVAAKHLRDVTRAVLAA